MKKVSKITFLILFMVIGLLFMELPTVQAAGAQDIIDNISTSDIGSYSGINSMAQRILGLIRGASVVAAVILIAVFGFKFILGSAEEKKDYMKSFIPLIIGVVLVFAATSIGSLIFTIVGA